MKAASQTDERPARILIVDDHPMMREGLLARIANEPDMTVCGEADDVDEALAQVDATSPDLAIIDISLRSGHGIDLIKQIKSRYPMVKMLVLSAYEESLYAQRSLRAGALGYINKQQCREHVIDAVRRVLDGKRYLSPELTDRILGQAMGSASATAASPLETLSDRELEVFKMIGQGMTTSAIANRLGLSTHTIDTHREKIKRKLNTHSGAELTRQAVQWVIENA